MSKNRNIVWVDFATLEKFMTDVFQGLGVPPEDAAICARVLIAADMRGIDSHGINRLKLIYYDRIRDGIIKPVTRVEVVREGPATAVIDGHNGMGQVIAYRSMRLAIDKAKKYGLGMVAVRNSNHYGIAGYYPLMAVDEGMIGMTGTNARPSIAPTFGVENMLGTNPLTFAMPTDEPFPFFLDCATSVTQRGKIEVYAKANKNVPPGWVIDEHGHSLTDSNRILKDLVAGTAALTPLGGIGEETAGYKGYGYATVVEILSAALQQGSYLKMLLGFQDGRKTTYNLGHFFMAVDIAAFTEVADFKKTAGDILRALRTSKKMAGADRIYTAGEKEYLVWQERKNKGVPLNLELQNEIRRMIAELGLTGYAASFL
ncbi:MAG: Ldh family oxidoreductase [Verrucomicrobia bacterium]|nr:Ldh family oxidoreductase [Verrucomicrobiota bacterium]MBU4248202.1 Ldh family oxidoreductase [Verrucomicrobiota bacterium]MBU4429972.1 Ldh family oxidoreductase [Verrucomicrobiota bacterium]MBU4497394.1 Ldh family oxidoreductase [Verrucomicrobiota bacterium]MCG2679900.1 Ldh family oxidoreductase [Kiritimatiellia bacterium]